MTSRMRLAKPVGNDPLPPLDISDTEYEDSNGIPLNFKLHVPNSEHLKFDIDELRKLRNDDSKELWIVRVPNMIENSKLDGMTFKMPPRNCNKVKRLATFDQAYEYEITDDESDSELLKTYKSIKKYKEKKENLKKAKHASATYGIHCLPSEITKDDSSSSSDFDDTMDILCATSLIPKKSEIAPVGSEELYDISLLLPSNKKNGNLILEPMQFDRHLTVTRLYDIPDPTEAALKILSEPKIPLEPPAGLKMQFKPYGFDTGFSNNNTDKKKRKLNEFESESNASSSSKSISLQSPINTLKRIKNDRPKTPIQIPGLPFGQQWKNRPKTPIQIPGLPFGQQRKKKNLKLNKKKAKSEKFKNSFV
ncbi:4109_t:CDS:2 [Ambispora gerdemannii]|uniref:4109_t:CDS:1 n=1 Tax=Ambispora gerdemannii TaxID=144530 RepID=A0A9N8VN07_9GLOM|nr:4109_t:CDS:2 [Ambispora gerdemannii]